MKTQNPWMGRVKGSAGNMTGCKVYDKNVLRAKAFEVSNPDTTAQQTQRNFFKEVAAIVATVSEEELRSLFGIKPKGMSRRNAFSKQVAAAYSIEGNEKSVDFSKLQAIGNGAKVTTPICEVINGASEDQTEITPSLLGSNADASTNLILVFFNTDENAIQIFNTDMLAGSSLITDDVIGAVLTNENGFAYVTCATDGKDVSLLPFGSFTLKTRSAGKQVEPTPPASKVTIFSSGTEAGSFFHFDGSLFNYSNGDEPDAIKQELLTICKEIQWDKHNNWWYGNINANVSTSEPLTIEGTINGEQITDIPVEWVVQ